MAALKTELIQSEIESKIFVADIGIPHQLYTDLGIPWPDFSKSGILEFTPDLPHNDNYKQ